MKNEEKKPKKEKKYRILPLSEKKKAVDLFLKGDIPIAEIAAQYGVNLLTITQKWVKQVERGKDRLAGGYKMPSQKLRLKVVREIVSGTLTIEEAMSRYDIVAEATIHKW